MPPAVQHRHDVGVAVACQGPQLGAALVVRKQHLQGDLGLQPLIPRAVDQRETAYTQNPAHDEAVRDALSDRQDDDSGLLHQRPQPPQGARGQLVRRQVEFGLQHFL